MSVVLMPITQPSVQHRGAHETAPGPRSAASATDSGSLVTASEGVDQAGRYDQTSEAQMGKGHPSRQGLFLMASSRERLEIAASVRRWAIPGERSRRSASSVVRRRRGRE